MDETQNPECHHSSVVPEQYRPYSCMELTEEQIEYARIHLNETEETREKYLRRIKRFIDRELDEFSEMDDAFLLAFLRRKKFNFKHTRLLLAKSVEFLETNRDYFKRIDIEILNRLIASKVVGFLPYRDATGKALMLAKAENWDPDDLTAEDVIFGTIIATHISVLENPVNQVSGYVIIIDCKNFTYRQCSEYVSWVLFVSKSLKCSPTSIKEIHVINAPSILLMGWNIVKPFMDERSKYVVTIHESLESLHETIPPCILPQDIGGDLEPFSNDHWATDVSLIREKFFGRLHKILSD